MTTTITEIQFDDIDIDGTPPCEIYRRLWKRLCGQPSVARIRMRCYCKIHIAFVCAESLEMILKGGGNCSNCLTTLIFMGYL